MTKLYLPRITVTLKRDFDGVTEYEITATEAGTHAELLERIVKAAIGLSLQAKPAQSEEGSP